MNDICRKMKAQKLEFLAISLILAAVFIHSVAAAPLRPSKLSMQRADRTLRTMTTDEKIGQLIHIGTQARFANQDSLYFRELRRHVVENKVGGIIFFVSPVYEMAHLANRMQSLAKHPLLISLDAETGIGMRFMDAVNFPWAMAVTATGEPELARRMGAITAREAKAMGIRHVFAPVLDVNNNADNPVINVRSFGEDPQDVARFGVAFAEGLQSERVLATAKHFPGHGDTHVDSHRGLPVIDLPRDRLDAVELFPFRRAVEAGIGSVMIAHIALPQIDGEVIKPLTNYYGGDAEPGSEIVTENATIPATLSYKVQTEILRNEIGFDGLIVSDAMSMSGLTLYFTQEEAGVRAVLAGTDILEKPENVDSMIRGLKEAVASGRIPMPLLDNAVKRQLAWKFELGLFSSRQTPLDRIDKVVSNVETEALADEIAAKAITLVRNGDNILPIDKTKKIAMIGISNGFDGPATMQPFAAELRAAGLRFKQVYLQENSLTIASQEARNAIADADIVIFGLYGRVRSGLRSSVGIPDNGAEVLREALLTEKEVVGISFGNPYLLTAFPEMQAYLVAYGDMPSLQRAAARSILGMQDIRGKLPITLPGLYPRGTGIRLKRSE